MAITRTQIARQLLALGGPVDAVNQLLGIENLMAGGINRPSGGYEIKSGMPGSKENRDKALDDFFNEAGPNFEDLRDKQMKDIAGQTSLVPLGTIISGAKGIFAGKGGAAVMKKMGKDIAAQKIAEKIARDQIEKELAERALKNARARAKRMGFRGSTRSDSAQSFADTQTYGGGGTRDDMGADTFI